MLPHSRIKSILLKYYRKIFEQVLKDRPCYTPLEVADAYFRSGADKISIGSDAVLIAEEYLKTGQSSIERISEVYGNQAVVISADPRRVYVTSPDTTEHQVIETAFPGPRGET